ncbi:uncharacterized protein MOCS2 isoform X2 [Cuculus canorus]|uniref:uncharacterized protein MOCS2 isoform X2 n=1 Tax=Cuculus canorus TaxID=55661 RepID=UPI0023AA5112|nr:uncharacterized protein MOCS2 isoform X2 [Cuculus canorus]
MRCLRTWFSGRSEWLDSMTQEAFSSLVIPSQQRCPAHSAEGALPVPVTAWGAGLRSGHRAEPGHSAEGAGPGHGGAAPAAQAAGGGAGGPGAGAAGSRRRAGPARGRRLHELPGVGAVLRPQRRAGGAAPRDPPGAAAGDGAAALGGDRQPSPQPPQENPRLEDGCCSFRSVLEAELCLLSYGIKWFLLFGRNTCFLEISSWSCSLETRLPSSHQLVEAESTQDRIRQRGAADSLTTVVHAG